MICFYEKNGLMVKVYDQGDDLQVLTNNEPQKERWFSKWSNDYTGSVYNAIGSVILAIDPTKDKPVFDIKEVQWLNKTNRNY